MGEGGVYLISLCNNTKKIVHGYLLRQTLLLEEHILFWSIDQFQGVRSRLDDQAKCEYST